MEILSILFVLGGFCPFVYAINVEIRFGEMQYFGHCLLLMQYIATTIKYYDTERYKRSKGSEISINCW